MKDGAVPSIGTPPALTLEKIRKLWPRHPELVAEVTALLGWRDVWGTLVADGDLGPDSMPRPIEYKMPQPKALIECAARMRRAEQGINVRSVSDLHEAEVSFQHIIWLLSTLAPADREMKRRLRLWSADCVARVLPLFEITYPHDTLVRDALHAARRFARSEISDIRPARAAVLAASLLTRRLSADLVVSAASYLLRERDSWADNVAAKYSRSAAVYSCDHDDATGTEMQWQFARLIARMSAQEPDYWPLSQAPKESRFTSSCEDKRKIIGNVPSRLDYFADREDDIAKLHELLASSDNSKQRHLVVVRGLAGKTELAIEYAHRFADSYSGIWWCPAESRERLVESLVTLARRADCGMPNGSNRDSTAKLALENLADHQPPFLLIFDHAVRLDDLKAFIPGARARCIVTTGQKWFGTPEVVLQSVSNSAAADFLQRVAAISDVHAAKEIAARENCDLAILRTIGDECRRSSLSLRRWLEMDTAYVPYFWRKRSAKRGQQ